MDTPVPNPILSRAVVFFPNIGNKSPEISVYRNWEGIQSGKQARLPDKLCKSMSLMFFIKAKF